ncbi:MAG: hypothetical protein FWD33_03410 [Alphaproteobacteria bacterium]|nr:hypothetical protein [Alphaproteobacteria bacterium]
MAIATLKRIYEIASSGAKVALPRSIIQHLDKIAENALNQKGVYTAVITLGVYKILNPKQDIRNHKVELPGGFSGRSFDTKYITPTLMELELPHMAESGWLTRSIEQLAPFDKNFPGRIRVVKESFLEVVDFIQSNPNQVESALVYLIQEVIKKNEENRVEIVPIANPDKTNISLIISMLKEHFETNYKTHNAAKLPVIAFHSIYEMLINELNRFNKCKLEPLGSHTTCDRTSGQSGDIQIFNSKNKPFEAVEIKLGIPVDNQLLLRAKEKIYKTDSLTRYYILSSVGVKESERTQIEKQIIEIQEKHGCQVIVNGLYDTLKYYLRLVSDLDVFLNNYARNVSKDKELQPQHKHKWNEILEKTGLA